MNIRSWRSRTHTSIATVQLHLRIKLTQTHQVRNILETPSLLSVPIDRHWLLPQSLK